jgi:hypothetical protein
MPFDAFISYSSSDKIAADTTCALLEHAGVRCWIAPRDVRPGSEYGAAIIDAIDQCRVMVLIFSSNANASNQIRREIERAASKGLPIVPVRIEDVVPTKSLEYFLGPIHWLDALTQPIEKHLQQLSETVKAILNVETSRHIGSIDQRVRKVVEDPPNAPHASPYQKSSRLKLLRLLIAAGVGIVSIAAVIWFHQRNASAGKLCADETAAKSLPSDTPTLMIFGNKTGAPIKLFWLDFQGSRDFYGELASKETQRQETYLGHVWVVTNTQNDCIGLYRAEAGTKEIAIGP